MGFANILLAIMTGYYEQKLCFCKIRETISCKAYTESEF